MQNELLMALYDMIDNIKNSEDYINYKNLERIIMDKYSKEVFEFNKAKDEYNKALEYGKYYPGLEKIKNNLFDKKKNLYTKDEMIKYKELELKLDLLLEDINREIYNKIME